MPSPDTCCDSASPTVSQACNSPNTAPVSAATSTPVHNPWPAYTVSQPVKAPATMIPYAQVEHACAFAQQNPQRAQDERGGHAQGGDPERRVDEDVEQFGHAAATAWFALFLIAKKA